MTSNLLKLAIQISLLVEYAKPSVMPSIRRTHEKQVSPIVTFRIRLDSEHADYMKTRNWCDVADIAFSEESVQYVKEKYDKHIQKIVENFDRENRLDSYERDDPYYLNYDCNKLWVAYDVTFGKTVSVRNQKQLKRTASDVTCHVAKGLKKVIDRVEVTAVIYEVTSVTSVTSDNLTCGGGVIKSLPYIGSMASGDGSGNPST